jgi:integrase
MPTENPLPKYRHYKPKNLAVVRIDGRDHYLGTYNSPESWERYHRLLAEHAVKRIVSPSAYQGAQTGSYDLTILELILEYWGYVQKYSRKNGKPTSQVEQIRHALRPLRQLDDRTPAKEFGPLTLKTVRQQFINSGFCRSEINRKTQKIVRLFKWAVVNEKVPPSVHHGLKAVDGLKKGRCDARESRPVKPIGDHFVDAIRAHVSRQVWTMVELQRLTGMRPGEVVIMRTMDINTTGSIWEYRPDSHKTEHHGKDRVIFIGPKAQEILKPWLNSALSSYLFSPRESQAEHAIELRKARKTKVQSSQQNPRKKHPKRIPAEKYRVTGYALAIRRGCDRAFPHPSLSPLTVAGFSREQRDQYQELRRSLRSNDLSAERREKLTTAIKALLRQDLTEDQQAELRAWQKAHRWHPNQLRHSAATRLRREFGLDVAKAVPGHSSVIAITNIGRLGASTQISPIPAITKPASNQNQCSRLLGSSTPSSPRPALLEYTTKFDTPSNLEPLLRQIPL